MLLVEIMMFHHFINIICANIAVILLFGNCRVNNDHVDNFERDIVNFEIVSNSLIYSRKFTEALTFLKSFDDTCFIENDKLYILKYHNIGLVYYLNLNWELALQSFNRSLKLALLYNDTVGIVQNYVYLCTTHLNSRRFIGGNKYIDTLYYLTQKIF